MTSSGRDDACLAGEGMPPAAFTGEAAELPCRGWWIPGRSGLLPCGVVVAAALAGGDRPLAGGDGLTGAALAGGERLLIGGEGLTLAALAGGERLLTSGEGFATAALAGGDLAADVLLLGETAGGDALLGASRRIGESSVRCASLSASLLTAAPPVTPLAAKLHADLHWELAGGAEAARSVVRSSGGSYARGLLMA